MSESPPDLKTRQKAIAAELKTKVGLLLRAGMEKYYSVMVPFARSLERKYGEECKKYFLYHIMIPSSTDEKSSPYFDFDGEDSVENFINNLEI